MMALLISKSRKRLTILLIFVGLFAACLPQSPAVAGKEKKAVSEPAVNIMLGKGDMISFSGPVSDVLIANPGIVDVMAVKKNQLYVVGNTLGDTNLMVLDTSGNLIRKVNIHVQMDTDKLEDMIAQLYPDEDIQIRALTDQLVITGTVSTPAVSNSVGNLVAQYAAEIQGMTAGKIDEVVTNMLGVRGEQQVMLKVRIVEASRDALKDLGLETNLETTGEGSLVAGLASATALGLSSPTQLGALALNFSKGGFGPLNFLARALEQEGVLNTLAEPNLTAISGEQAGFLAGGEIPIPTELDRNGNLVYEFRPFGVSLNFRPTVLSENRISMEMSTEVSSTAYDDNLQLQGINIPSFNVRRAQTTVELPSGGTLMIAGLIQSSALSSLTGIPGVKNIPVVGDLLKSDSFQRNESELVVMITPYLVKPFANNVTSAQAKPRGLNVEPVSNLQDVPQLSIEDLEGTGLTEQKEGAVVETQPSAADPAQPPVDRSKNELGSVFKDNIRRNYNVDKVNQMMDQMGRFGYLTE